MSNPQIPQGVLNRLLNGINFPDNPQLNITPSFLDKDQSSIAFEGQATNEIETASGIVLSPEPYIKVSVRLHILKSQSLSATWLQFLQNSSVVGGYTLYTDSSVFPSLTISNGAIKNVEELLLNGTKADFTLVLGGYYQINNSLWL
jgi:hypothetical protein